MQNADAVIKYMAAGRLARIVYTYMPISIRLHQHQINKRSIFIITLFQFIIYQEGRLRLYCRGRGIKIHVNLIAVLTLGIEKHKIDLMI